jgi:hypothetical protein
MENCITKQQGNVLMKIKTGYEKLGTWENMKSGDIKFLQHYRIFR